MKKILFLIWLLVVIGMYLGLTYQHELTHKQIYSYWGINSTMGFDLTTFYVNATDYPDYLTSQDYRILNSLHSLNEVVSYQYDAIFLFLSVILLVIIFKLSK